MLQDVESIHISSLVVHCLPEKLSIIKSEIRVFENVDIVADDVSGKLVLVLETETEKEILSIIDQLQILPGVLATTMVYHELDC